MPTFLPDPVITRNPRGRVIDVTSSVPAAPVPLGLSLRQVDHLDRVWSAEAPHPLRPVIVTPEVDAAIRSSVGLPRPEQGGLLGGSRLTGRVELFEFDSSGQRTGASYTPDIAWVNRRVRAWYDDGVGLLGFVHSHPSGMPQLSSGDLAYAERLLATIPRLDRLVLPVVQSASTPGAVQIWPWVVFRGSSGVTVSAVKWLVRAEPVATPPAVQDAFARVTEAYDLELMQRSRVVVVGTGGSTAFLEALARSGLGELVLIDPDQVEAPNIATQAHSWRDVGRDKVLCAAERAWRASPTVHTVTVARSLDELSDEQFEDLAHECFPGRPRPLITLVVGATDSFAAQARTARLALTLQLPAMAGQVYPYGSAVEVTFAVPGHSKACQRCALGGRYRAYEEGNVSTARSYGSPYSTTMRLNALEELVAVTLIHGAAGERNCSGGRRHLDLFERIKTRNLVQVRCTPDAPLPSLDRALAGADQERLVVDETVWLPQEPENPETGFAPCGDCGGIGNLLQPPPKIAPPTRDVSPQLPPNFATRTELASTARTSSRDRRRKQFRVRRIVTALLTLGILLALTAIALLLVSSSSNSSPSPAPSTRHLSPPSELSGIPGPIPHIPEIDGGGR